MPVSSHPSIHLVCGSTGAGKTTYAAALAQKLGGMRFSIDEWMTDLFWMDSPEPIAFDWTMERIARCETRIWAIALQAAAAGISPILDLGLSRADHRAKFAGLARTAGLPVRLHWIDIPTDERWRRVERRNAEKGETFRIIVTRAMFDFVEGLWDAPTESEMAAMNGVRLDGGS